MSAKLKKPLESGGELRKRLDKHQADTADLERLVHETLTRFATSLIQRVQACCHGSCGGYIYVQC